MCIRDRAVGRAPSAVHRAETLAAWRVFRLPGVDRRGGKEERRMVDYLGIGVERWLECHCAMVCHMAHSDAAGIGHGMLFTDNVPMPLEIRKDCLWYVADGD